MISIDPTDPGGSAVHGYVRAGRAALDRIETRLEAVGAAADLLTPVIMNGGVVHCFGTGHSRIVTLELCARAGGLACFAMVAFKDLVMFGDTDPERILDPTCERDAELGRQLFELTPIEPGDALVVVSNSGRNASVIEFTQRARAADLPTVVITSLEHTSQVTAAHPSGLLLKDLGDVVIDNGAPLGDAVLDLPDGGRVTALSSLTGVYLSQLLTAAIVDRLLAAGAPVPTLTSQNVAGGDDRNADLYRRYARIRPIEP